MYNGMCFEAQLCISALTGTVSSMQILGFDVMLDQKLQPWLLEAHQIISAEIGDLSLSYVVRFSRLRMSISLSHEPCRDASHVKAELLARASAMKPRISAGEPCTFFRHGVGARQTGERGGRLRPGQTRSPEAEPVAPRDAEQH